MQRRCAKLGTSAQWVEEKHCFEISVKQEEKATNNEQFSRFLINHA
jgi:hypothetical protein